MDPTHIEEYCTHHTSSPQVRPSLITPHNPLMIITCSAPPPLPPIQGAVCGSLTLCYLPSADMVSTVHHEGPLEGEEAKTAIKLALEAALRVREAARQCMPI